MNNHTNGIDIYLLKSDTTECLGLANGIGTGTELLLYVSFEGLPLCTTHVISHEMGHILNLYHTHHGTFNGNHENDNDPNSCLELSDHIVVGEGHLHSQGYCRQRDSFRENHYSIISM
jgi:hypothetical protein